MKLLFLRKAGRCANGAERDSGSVVHAVPKSGWVALCGAKPGRHSGGWGDDGVEGGPSVPTCPSCQRLVEVVTRMEAAGGKIERRPGGFWTPPGTPSRESAYGPVPEWSVTNGAIVLRAFASRGYIEESKRQPTASGSFCVEYTLKEPS